MLADYELFTMVNAKIAELVNTAQQELGIEIDMIISNTDKYENTRDESIEIALGCSKGLKSERYYFNAINDEKSEYFQLADKYFNEPVRYYEEVGTVDRFSLGNLPVAFHIQVQTFRRIITIYKVGYGVKNEPIFTKIETIDMKPSKFQKKIKEVVGA